MLELRDRTSPPKEAMAQSIGHADDATTACKQVLGRRAHAGKERGFGALPPAAHDTPFSNIIGANHLAITLI